MKFEFTDRQKEVLAKMLEDKPTWQGIAEGEIDTYSRYNHHQSKAKLIGHALGVNTATTSILIAEAINGIKTKLKK